MRQKERQKDYSKRTSCMYHKHRSRELTITQLHSLLFKWLLVSQLYCITNKCAFKRNRNWSECALFTFCLFSLQTSALEFQMLSFPQYTGLVKWDSKDLWHWVFDSFFLLISFVFFFQVWWAMTIRWIAEDGMETSLSLTFGWLEHIKKEKEKNGSPDV